VNGPVLSAILFGVSVVGFFFLTFIFTPLQRVPLSLDVRQRHSRCACWSLPWLHCSCRPVKRTLVIRGDVKEGGTNRQVAASCRSGPRP
jgi:hypothetical protein